jgi:hypothetical protein
MEQKNRCASPRKAHKKDYMIILLRNSILGLSEKEDIQVIDIKKELNMSIGEMIMIEKLLCK